MIDFFNENELLYLIRNNDDEAFERLMEYYHRVIWAIAHEFGSAGRFYGISPDDMYQEGALGLFEAIDRFNEVLNVPFRSFARVCIERNIRSLIRKHRGLSYGIISRSVSLDMPVGEDDGLYLKDTIANNYQMYDPVFYTEYKEKERILLEKCDQFSRFEKRVFKLRNLGYSYAEIGEQLNISAKAVDNALQRIKKKLVSLFD